METLWLCSGGSALSYIEQLTVPDDVSTWTITVLDERWSTDPSVNNFAQLVTTSFFEQAVARGAKTIDTRVKPEESLAQLARRFEEALRLWRAVNPKGKVIAIMGIGADAHTAGMMPMPDEAERFRRLFDDAHVWVVGYDAGAHHAHRHRVTVTLPFLREQVNTTTVYVKRTGKESAIETVTDPSHYTPLHRAPARIILAMKNVQWHIVLRRKMS